MVLRYIKKIDIKDMVLNHIVKKIKNLTAMKMAKENNVNLIKFYLNKLNNKIQKEHNYYIKNNDKHQFLINNSVYQQVQSFVQNLK